MYEKREYHFRAVYPLDETTSCIADFCAALTAGESIGERRDRATKKCAGRKFLKQCKKGCLALNLTFGAERGARKTNEDC